MKAQRNARRRGRAATLGIALALGVVFGVPAHAVGQPAAVPVRLLPIPPGVRRAAPVPIRYAIDGPVKSLTIEIVDEKGAVVQRYSDSASAAGVPGGQPLPTTVGEHTVAWDLRHACGTAFAGIESPSLVRELDPWAVPGIYRVRLTADHHVVTTPLVVEAQPAMTATRADLEAQLALALEMCDVQRTAMSAVARSAGGAAVVAPWSGRLAVLRRKVTAGDGRPAEDDYAVFRALRDELPGLLERLVPAGVSGGQPDASIKFDSQGVDFGPWLKAFIARLRQHWLIPFEVARQKGHVVVQFYVEQSGAISDLAVPAPSAVDAFNKAAWGAVVEANPAPPLPKGYRQKRCFFTVTFYYNESPGQ